MKGFRTYLLPMLLLFLLAAPFCVKAQEVEEDTVPSVQVVTGDDVVEYARTFKGVPYKLGAAGPKAFDCSSFTRYVYRHFGYDITAYSQVQFREGRPVESYSDLQKGDLVFFCTNGDGRVSHVGIYLKDYKFVHASSSRGVAVDDLRQNYYATHFHAAARVTTKPSK